MSRTPLCRFLRWKSFYGAHFRTDEELRAALSEAGVPFRCLKTCECWGPDGDLVAPDDCTEARGCFETSPKTPLRSS